jgi:hypothetical protein
MTEALYRIDVTYGSGFIMVPRDGETHREFLLRAGRLRLRKNGKLDMRFRSSQAVEREEARQELCL